MNTITLAVRKVMVAAGIVCSAALLWITPQAVFGQNRETVIHDFPQTTADGNTPVSTPCADPSSNMIYVASKTGGTAGRGAVVCLNPNKAGFAVIHSFTGPDGSYPTGALLLVSRGSALPPYLYGTTLKGGTSASGALVNRGTLFRVTADGKVFQTLHVFVGGRGDGANPYAGLILASNGQLYGTTLAGGLHSLGTVYSATLTGKIAVIHSFAGQQIGAVADGAKPYARLLEYQKGALVGTTASGGSANAGTIFALIPAQHTYAVAHNFAGNASDGGNPTADLTLVMGADGAISLFGTTVNGGTNNGGTVYMTGGNVNNYLVIYNLGAPGDGSAPWAGLTFDSQTNMLYGTSRAGGAFGAGSVFELLPAVQTQESVAYSFNPFGIVADGGAPIGGLVLYAGNGLLYGACSDQGTNFGGTAYAIVP